MKKTITINEMIAALKSEGMELTREQLWSYIEKGILPYPELSRTGDFGVIYPLDMLKPLKRFLSLRDQGVPLPKIKAGLMDETLRFVSELFKNRGMEMERIYHLALPNIEIDEGGGVSTDRGFSGFFIDLLEATLWRSGESREEIALATLHRQFLRWKASVEALWEKFEKVEPGDSWKGKRTKISQAYSEVISNLNG